MRIIEKSAAVSTMFVLEAAQEGDIFRSISDINIKSLFKSICDNSSIITDASDGRYHGKV
jgi:hypothetical protein